VTEIRAARQNSTEDGRQTEVRSEVLILCGAVTVIFRVLSLFIVTTCYSYSKIVLPLIVVPPGEYLNSCGFVDVGRSLCREDGSVVYNCW
jgi:hypothetical protein